MSWYERSKIMSEASVTADAAYPAAALGAFAESHLRGRRVGVLGDATTRLGEELLSRGARLVHLYDPDPGRLAVAAAQARGAAQRSGEAGRQARPILAQFADDLGVRDGAFDVVLVADLSLFDDPLELIRRARRLVSPSGLFIVASPNPEAKRFLLPPSGSLASALGYYELFDAISLQFPEVKMLGQAPFVGYSIVDFSETDPDVSVDTSLLEEPEAPEWYVVVASDRRVDVDPYALVEIPLAEVARFGAQDPVTLPRIPVPSSGPSDFEVALTEARTRISVLVTENETLREQQKDRVRLERAAAEAAARTQELERELAAAKSRASELAMDLEAQATRNEEQDATVERLEAELDVERRDREARHADAERATLVEQQLAGARRRIAELEAQVAALEPPTLRSKEQQQARFAALEAQRDEIAAREQQLLVRVGELEKRARELEERAREAESKAQRLDARRRELEDQARDHERGLSAARRDASEAQARLSELQTSAGAASVELAVERERLAEERARVAPLENELRALEDALRNRGREVVRLQRELRETEQVGRELLHEVERLSAGGSASGGGGGSGGVGGAHAPGHTPAAGHAPAAQSGDLAERAARAEADLMAATWKIAKLEREVAQGTQASPDAAARALELALAAAQREIALLRGPAGYDEAFLQPHSARGRATTTLEDAILLGQLERQREGRLERP